jgi:hypothetical protein
MLVYLDVILSSSGVTVRLSNCLRAKAYKPYIYAMQIGYAYRSGHRTWFEDLTTTLLFSFFDPPL